MFSLSSVLVWQGLGIGIIILFLQQEVMEYVSGAVQRVFDYMDLIFICKVSEIIPGVERKGERSFRGQGQPRVDAHGSDVEEFTERKWRRPRTSCSLCLPESRHTVVFGEWISEYYLLSALAWQWESTPWSDRRNASPSVHLAAAAYLKLLLFSLAKTCCPSLLCHREMEKVTPKVRKLCLHPRTPVWWGCILPALFYPSVQSIFLPILCMSPSFLFEKHSKCFAFYLLFQWISS